MRPTPLLTIALFFAIAIQAIGQDTQTLRFIQNKGQWNKEIDFQAGVPGGRLGVSAKGFSVFLLDMEELEHQHIASHDGVNESDGHIEPVDGKTTIYPARNLIGTRFSISDNMGKKEVTGELHNYVIDLSGFSAGVYILKIDGEKPIKISKH
jgi:hypothetical protein